MSPSLVLASGSPRRKELLGQLGLAFEVLPADLDESLLKGERPDAYVKRLATAKAEIVAMGRPGALVLGADTTVCVDGKVLGKPADAKASMAMLRKLQGRSHEVFTGIAVAGAGRTLSRTVKTRVTFRALSAREIAWYAATPEPYDKAGGYAVQGIAGAFVTGLSGSISNVVGLPLAETLALLEKAGLALPWSAPAKKAKAK